MIDQKMLQIPMWVIDQIREGIRLTPGTWTAIDEAIERAEKQGPQERVDQQTRLDAARYRKIRAEDSRYKIVYFAEDLDDCLVLSGDDADSKIDATLI